MSENEYKKHDCPDFDYSQSTEEFSSDFITETERNNVDEFVELPNEFSAETSREFSENIDRDGCGCGDGCGCDENHPCGHDGCDIAPHNFESGSDNVQNDLRGIYDSDHSDEIENNYDIESADDYDSEAMQYVDDPNDETAATIDEWYTTDTPAQEHCKLDDYEIISDVLGSEKEIVKLYSTALCEAAEEPLRDIIRENFDEAAADQYKAFTFMQERGMYQTEQATEEKITEAKQQFTPLCKNCCNND